MCDECEYSEGCFCEADCVYVRDGELKEAEEEECTNPIEEALRIILE